MKNISFSFIITSVFLILMLTGCGAKGVAKDADVALTIGMESSDLFIAPEYAESVAETYSNTTTLRTSRSCTMLVMNSGKEIKVEKQSIISLTEFGPYTAGDNVIIEIRTPKHMFDWVDNITNSEANAYYWAFTAGDDCQEVKPDDTPNEGTNEGTSESENPSSTLHTSVYINGTEVKASTDKSNPDVVKIKGSEFTWSADPEVAVVHMITDNEDFYLSEATGWEKTYTIEKNQTQFWIIKYERSFIGSTQDISTVYLELIGK